MIAGSTAEWGLEVLEDYELPTWFLIPPGTDTSEPERWAADLQAKLPDAFEQHGPAPVADDVRDELEYALQAAAVSDALATFQVWPVAYPVSVLCSVRVIAGDFVPEPADGGRVVAHDTQARHLGPGTQYTLEHTIGSGSEAMTLVELHFVFSDDEISIVFSLSASLATITASALPGFALLKDSVGLRQRDGTRFEATPSRGTSPGDFWPLGGDD